MDDGDWCQVRADGCWGRATQSHHRKLRSQGGTNEPENLLRVCAPCHLSIHVHVADSVERGWIVRSWDEVA